jgi:hypothetical protein
MVDDQLGLGNMTGKFKPRKVPDGQAAGKHKELDPQVRDQIGHRLKAIYQRVADEPVPDKFIELLRQLDEKGRTG